MKRRTVLVSVVVLIAAFVVGNGGAGSSAPNPHRNKALSYALRLNKAGKIEFLPNGAPVPSLSGGVVVSATEILNESALMGSVSSQSTSLSPGFTRSSSGCANSYSGSGAPTNIRANQDCGLRRQAEEQVAVNPADPLNIVVGQNDSRVGFNQTGIDWSVDGGKRWGDYSVPTRFLNCAGIGYDAASDPAIAFDAAGNMYYAAVMFDVNDPVSGLLVWKSDANNKGSFLHNPASQLSANPVAVHENCADVNLSPDKELIAADAFASSPFAGNVYVTWTMFDFSCGGFYCASPINFSRSTDGGNTWSDPLEISGTNPEICSFGDAFDENRAPGNCDFDQGSIPVVGPDGSINVAFNNCNTTLDAAQGVPAVCQQLFVRSTDGGLTWSEPVQVGLDYATQPFNLGDPAMTAAGCPVGRQCLLPNGYRMNDFPAMGVDEQSGKLAVFWSDFRNGGPCAEDTSLGLVIFTEPCANHNQDVFAAVSKDGGATWGDTEQVTTGTAAQWQAWGDVAEGGTLFAGYYDRDNSGCEASGCNDITLARSKNDGAAWTTRLITTGPMPNLTPANNPFQAGFLGDYMWVSAVGSSVYLAWADTRGVGGSENPVPEEDVYFARLRGFGSEGNDALR